ncbi:glycine zipper 2TM domain-containing protein [Robiginitomaculum antarcticum]|uniref:glycine zipper 2TM domain-containing protein n=1 Tax=Robiginitomaculum antarcticum TaxID=437507 RepID=UPI000399CFFB|nr:glycine zipper 2TM domain-containing protein [Robiginitomaculum antarcticum]
MTYTDLTKGLSRAGFAAAALAATSFALPGLASAQNYGYYAGDQYNAAHEQCKKDEKRDKLVGGLIGAVIGGVVGSNVAGDGVQDEGTAIGAVVGGLAGAGIADKRVDCDPAYGNGYNDSYNTQYNSQRVVYGQGGYQNSGYQNDGYNQGTYNQGTYPVYQTGTYRTPQPVYRQQPVYRHDTYGQQRRQDALEAQRQERLKAAQRAERQQRKAYRKGYHTGQAQTHYHGKYICYDHH